MYASYGLPTFPMLVPGFLGALAWLGASRRKVGSRPTLYGGVILHRGLLSAALGKSGRLLPQSVTGYGPMSSFLPLFLHSLVNQDRQDYFMNNVLRLRL